MKLFDKSDLIGTHYLPALTIVLLGLILWPAFSGWVVSVIAVGLVATLLWSVGRLYTVSAKTWKRTPEWKVGLCVWSTMGVAWLLYFSVLGLFARPTQLSIPVIAAFLFVPIFAVVAVWGYSLMYTHGTRSLSSWSAILPHQKSEEDQNIVFNVMVRIWVGIAPTWLIIFPFYVLAHLFVPKIFVLGHIELHWLVFATVIGILCISKRLQKSIRTGIQNRFPLGLLILFGMGLFVLFAYFFYWLMLPFSIGFRAIPIIQLGNIFTPDLLHFPEIWIWSSCYWAAVAFGLGRRYANWFGNRSVWIWALLNPFGLVVGVYFLSMRPMGHLLFACAACCMALIYISSKGFHEDIAATFAPKERAGASNTVVGQALRRFLLGFVLSGVLFPWTGITPLAWISLSSWLCMMAVACTWLVRARQ